MRDQGQALVQCDLHLFLPSHGYYLQKDRKGLQRSDKEETIESSIKHRQKEHEKVHETNFILTVVVLLLVLDAV
jgi:hypothetical protein